MNRSCQRGLLLALLTLSLSVAAQPADEAAPAPEAQNQDAKTEGKLALSGPEAQVFGQEDYGWYIFYGNMTTYPRFDNASKTIDRQINKTFRLLAPGFDDVKTFSDQRDELMLHSPFFGVVKVLDDKWDVFWQIGYTAGKVRTKSSDMSLALIPLLTDVELKRASLFTGFGSHWHPWGAAEMRKYDSMLERIKATKWFFASSVNFNYLFFEADIKAGPWPFGSLLNLKQTQHWRVWNISTLVGFDVPLSKRTLFSFNVNYNHFIDYGGDFSGPSVSSYFKTFF